MGSGLSEEMETLEVAVQGGGRGGSDVCKTVVAVPTSVDAGRDDEERWSYTVRTVRAEAGRR